MKIIPLEEIPAPQANGLVLPGGLSVQESSRDFYTRFCTWAATSNFATLEYLLPQILIENEIGPSLFEKRFVASKRIPPTQEEIDSFWPWFYSIEWGDVSTIENPRTQGDYLFHRHRIGLFRHVTASLLGERRAELTLTDVACSSGVTSLDFAEQGFKHVHGLELRDYSVRQANFLKRTFDVRNVDFLVEDARNLGNYSSDVVFCGGLLYHVTFPVELLQSLFNATKKFLIFDSLCDNHPFSGFHIVGEVIVANPMEGDTSIQLVPTYRAIIDLLRNAGFQEIYEILVTDVQQVPLYNSRNVRSFLAVKPGVQLQNL